MTAPAPIPESGTLAEVLAPLSVGFLLAYIDWRGALVISVFPTVLLGICFFWVARAVPRVERKSVSKQDMLGLLNMWSQGDGLRMVVMICLYNMALMALLSMIPLYLADRHGFGPEAAGIAFSTMLIVGALAQPWVGKISDIALTPRACSRAKARSGALTCSAFTPSAARWPRGRDCLYGHQPRRCFI